MSEINLPDNASHGRIESASPIRKPLPIEIQAKMNERKEPKKYDKDLHKQIYDKSLSRN